MLKNAFKGLKMKRKQLLTCGMLMQYALVKLTKRNAQTAEPLIQNFLNLRRFSFVVSFIISLLKKNTEATN